jgi:hypothetical protein
MTDREPGENMSVLKGYAVGLLIGLATSLPGRFSLLEKYFQEAEFKKEEMYQQGTDEFNSTKYERVYVLDGPRVVMEPVKFRVIWGRKKVFKTKIKDTEEISK